MLYYIALIHIALILAYLSYNLLTVVQQRKLIKLIESNLVKLHLITAGITSSVISYKRNC